MFYLSFDPGGTTGWALMADGRPAEGGEVSYDKIWDFLNDSKWDDVGLYIVEAYIIRDAKTQGGYAHQWNKGEALQVIGGIKCLANRKAAVVIEQQPTIKSTAHQRLTGKPYNKNAASHMLDATLHGFYYWWKENPERAQAEFKTSSSDSNGEGISSPTRVVKIRGYEGLRGKGRRRSV